MMEKDYSKNEIILFLRPDSFHTNRSLLERSKTQVWRSPQGRDILTAGFANKSAARTASELTRFATAQVNISCCSKVIFDYSSQTETFLP